MLAEFAHPPQKMGQDKSYCQQWCVHPLSFYHRLTSHSKAGFTYDKMLHTMPDDVYDVIMKVHVRAPFRLIHAAAPYFRIKSSSPENRTIINVSSTTGLHGNVGQANYAAVLPSAFATPSFQGNESCEYNRLLSMLSIPALSDLPNQDTLQNALSGWCAHYGHSHAASQLNCGVVLDYPAIYRIARLPVVLDNLFGGRDKAMKCSRCETVPVDAAICLICGTTCCMQSHCCIDGEANDRGECNMHTRESVTQFFAIKS